MLGSRADLILLVAILAPLLGGVASVPRSGRTGRSAVISTATALVGAAVVVVAAGTADPASWSSGGRLLVEADRLGALLLAFVLSATLVVQSYAARSLRGDLQRHRFFLASGVAAAGTATVVVAADLWVATLGWVVVSWATVALLLHDGRPIARAGARRAALTFLVGDAALVGAAVLASRSVGPVTLRPAQLADLVASPEAVGASQVVGVLALAAVAAAITRSALPPAQSWLPTSVAAPTPSSALLHAGIVNGGGVLLIRFAPMLAVSRAATAVAVLAGCAGVLVGAAVARTRPDVKTGLAWSTVAQMGFMVTQCVTGLFGPALVHMVAHGMYKSNLFLGSGSTLAHTHPAPPDTGPRLGRTLLTALATAVSVGVAWLVVRPAAFAGAPGVVFAGFIAATVAQAAWAWLRARPERSRVDLAALVALMLATTAAVGLAAAIKAWIAPSLPELDPALASAGAWALAVTGVLGVLVAVAARHARGPLAAVTERAYLWSLHLGDPARLAPVTLRSEGRR